MTARTFSLPRDLIAQNTHLASNDLGDIMDARRPTPNKVKDRQVTPKIKPSKKKKKSPDLNSPTITPTVF